MIEEFKSASWEDFSRRYKGVFGWYVKDDGKKILTKIEDVSPLSVKFVGKEEISFTAFADKGCSFEFLPVERGLYNTENDVIFCQRQPARQWRRGICSANTEFISLLEYGHGNIHPEFDILEAIFTNVDYTKFTQDWLLKRRNGVALNPCFAVINSALYLYNRKIGTVAHDQIVLNNEMFKQEIEDLVREKSLPYTVK